MPLFDSSDHDKIRRDLVRSVINDPLYSEIAQAKKEPV
jgi:hypothetical protein